MYDLRTYTVKALGFGARHVLQLIDTFIEHGALNRKAQGKLAA